MANELMKIEESIIGIARPFIKLLKSQLIDLSINNYYSALYFQRIAHTLYETFLFDEYSL